jgi:two-component system response regulator (stage 0 sporulation protein A)
MSELSVLFADDYENVRQNLSGFSKLEFTYRTCEKDGNVVLEELMKNPVDVIVMDFFMKGVDALGVLERFQHLNPLITPAVIVISGIDNPTIKNEVIKKGATFYLNKPVRQSVIVSKIMEIKKIREANRIPSNAFTYYIDSEAIITKVIQELCIPAHLKGYKYLRVAIKSSIENTKLVNSMTTVLYPLVAENYEVSSESVERSIRTAIQLAWDRGNPEAFSKYFGYNSQVRKKRPTNAEFIARISDEIRIKYNVS